MNNEFANEGKGAMWPPFPSRIQIQNKLTKYLLMFGQVGCEVVFLSSFTMEGLDPTI